MARSALPPRTTWVLAVVVVLAGCAPSPSGGSIPVSPVAEWAGGLAGAAAGERYGAGRAALGDRLTARVDRRADAVARSVPVSARGSVRSLADHLSAHAGPTMRGRTRAAFRFVADHVAYDVAAVRSGPRPSQHPRVVLGSGSAVCEGYARLLVTLLDAMGLEVAYVTGWADLVGPGGGGGHAWVAVRLADGWYLMDPTWAAGGVNSGGRFVRRFDAAWWLVSPERMVRTHRPFDRRWRLGA
ncbi:MAG: transglutaminase domain-containing protein [Bacteroidota bacterium]